MKSVISVSLLILVSTFAYAQADNNKIVYSRKIVMFTKMKRIGVVATFFGAAANIVGVITMANSKVTTNYNAYGYPQSVTTGTPLTGLVEILVGSTAVGAGVPLWVIGGINQKNYKRKVNTVTMNFNISPTKTGLRITYRF